MKKLLYFSASFSLLIVALSLSYYIGIYLPSEDKNAMKVEESRLKQQEPIQTAAPTIAVEPTIVPAAYNPPPSANAAEIGRQIKAKYPDQYGMYSDEEVGQRWLQKYGSGTSTSTNNYSKRCRSYMIGDTMYTDCK